MIKIDLFKDIIVKFDSFDEKYLLLLNINKNFNLYNFGKKLELFNFMYVILYYWWMFDRGIGCRFIFIYCVLMVIYFLFFL